MIDYLREMLGLSSEESTWKEEKTLPRYLRSKRKYVVLCIEDTKLLLIYVKEAEFNVQAFIKQMDKLREYWNGEMVLGFDRLSTYQRKTLISQHIPFIVPNAQIYVPRLGVMLQEKQSAPVKTVEEHFSAGGQFVFLYMLYHADEFPMSKTELSRKTNTNAMAITRAIQELLQFELAICKQKGRSDYVVPACISQDLWQKGKPYLINPVRKKVYVQNDAILNDYPFCGEYALAELSMLSKPMIPTRAISRKEYKEADKLIQVDPAWEISGDYTELEIWAYDPSLFVQNKHVDPVSLAASLGDSKDERIEDAIDEMMEACQW